MKEYKIGEIFEERGVKMVCLPALDYRYENTCAVCAFKDRSSGWCEEIACLAKQRKDKKYVFFSPLSLMGDNFHYSKKLGRVVAFKPTGDQPIGVVCKKCALGHFKTATWTDCCEGALCIGIMRKDRQDGYFVELDKMEEGAK